MPLAGLRALWRCPFFVWIVPFILAGVIFGIHESPLKIATTKSVQEILGPSILAIAFVIGCISARIHREPWHIWLCLLSLTLFVRELGYHSLDHPIYLIVACLCVWAVANFDRLRPYVESRLLFGLLVATFWVYFNTQVLDRMVGNVQDVISRPALRICKAIEETGETSGHVMLLVLVVCSWLLKVRLTPGGDPEIEPDQQPTKL